MDPEIDRFRHGWGQPARQSCALGRLMQEPETLMQT